MTSARIWLVLVSLLAGGTGTITLGQIPPPKVGESRSAEFATRREAIDRDEQERSAAAGLPARPVDDQAARDGSTRFVPLAEVVVASPAQVSPAERAIRLDSAGKRFDLALAASKASSVPLAFIDACLRDVLARDPNHAQARRLLGFIPHGSGGWVTPFAAAELASKKVKDPTFGWVPADWIPHLQAGELPAPGANNRWLPTAQADALRREWRRGWTIYTEHFEIHSNVPLADVITFGGRLEAFHQLFFALMADLIGSENLPLARRLAQPGLQPTLATRPKTHQVYYFATRDEYATFLAPHLGAEARRNLGIYVPRKEDRTFGGRSYFFNDVGGQLDITETLYHEVSHQLLFESAGTDNYTRNHGNFWVFEGLGTYFETLRPGADGSIRVGGLVGPRIARAHERIIGLREMIPIEAFVAMNQPAFLGKTGEDVYFNYAEAMALAVFLMQSRDGRYREGFLDYARDAYKGHLSRGSGHPLDDRLDVTYADLQREFLAYLARFNPPGRAEEAGPATGR